MAMTPEERTLRARLAALEMHAKGRTNTAPAREAMWRRFLDQVDPERVLPEEERNRRAEQARRAHCTRMAMKSVTARRKAREARERAARLEADIAQLEAERRGVA